MRWTCTPDLVGPQLPEDKMGIWRNLLQIIQAEHFYQLLDNINSKNVVDTMAKPLQSTHHTEELCKYVFCRWFWRKLSKPINCDCFVYKLSMLKMSQKAYHNACGSSTKQAIVNTSQTAKVLPAVKLHSNVACVVAGQLFKKWLSLQKC